MYKKIIVVLATSLTLFAGVEESKIKPVMIEKTEKITSILKTSTSTKAQKESKIINLVEKVFSYETMAKISLGKRWSTLNGGQQNKFVQRFKEKLQKSYFDKLELYNNQRIIIKDSQKINPSRISLESVVIGKDTNYNIMYKFYKNGNKNDWLIYDVDLAGVSIVQSYRQQFNDFLKTKSFDELLKSL